MSKKYTKCLILVIIVVLTILVFVSINNKNKESPKNTNKIKIVTSFYPLYFFTSEIAKDRAEIINITPAGAEPHEYEPTAGDIAQMENADLLILNGGGLESWEKNIESNLRNKNKILITGEGLMTISSQEKENINADPHIWLSPSLATKMVDVIENKLSEVDPANETYYKGNSNSLKNELLKLDEDYRQGLSSCESDNIITSHTAFSYLAKDYGLNQVSVAGLSPEEEPSSKEMLRIAEWAKKNSVKYIFFESLVSPKLSETIASEIGAKVLVLNPIEGLTDEQIKSGDNYLKEMRNNLINLRTALQCK